MTFNKVIKNMAAFLMISTAASVYNTFAAGGVDDGDAEPKPTPTHQIEVDEQPDIAPIPTISSLAPSNSMDAIVLSSAPIDHASAQADKPANLSQQLKNLLKENKKHELATLMKKSGNKFHNLLNKLNTDRADLIQKLKPTAENPTPELNKAGLAQEIQNLLKSTKEALTPEILSAEIARYLHLETSNHPVEARDLLLKLIRFAPDAVKNAPTHIKRGSDLAIGGEANLEDNWDITSPILSFQDSILVNTKNYESLIPNFGRFINSLVELGFSKVYVLASEEYKQLLEESLPNQVAVVVDGKDNIAFQDNKITISNDQSSVEVPYIVNLNSLGEIINRSLEGKAKSNFPNMMGYLLSVAKLSYGKESYPMLQQNYKNEYFDGDNLHVGVNISLDEADGYPAHGFTLKDLSALFIDENSIKDSMLKKIDALKKAGNNDVENVKGDIFLLDNTNFYLFNDLNNSEEVVVRELGDNQTKVSKFNNADTSLIDLAALDAKIQEEDKENYGNFKNLSGVVGGLSKIQLASLIKNLDVMVTTSGEIADLAYNLGVKTYLITPPYGNLLSHIADSHSHSNKLFIHRLTKENPLGKVLKTINDELQKTDGVEKAGRVQEAKSAGKA